MHFSDKANPIFIAMAMAVTAGISAVPAAAKSIQSLGTLGGASSFARGINELGVVVGEADKANGETHAFYYKPWERQLVDLGDRGGHYSQATAINNLGIAVGVSKSAPGNYCSDPVVWNTNRSGSVTVLPGLAPGNPYACSEPTAVNDAGVIVGSSNGKAVRWVGGKVQDLGSLGGENCFATGINLQGWIVGQCNVASTFRAFIWKNGVMKDLGDIGGTTVSVGGINAVGQVAGYGPNAAAVYSAFVWRNGTFTGLDPLGGPGNYGNARAISETGLLAGESSLGGGNSHAVWWDKQRNIHDLAALQAGSFSSAFGINSSGIIAGVSYVNTGDGATSGFRAVVWR